jgi:hypothetical protein
MLLGKLLSRSSDPVSWKKVMSFCDQRAKLQCLQGYPSMSEIPLHLDATRYKL